MKKALDLLNRLTDKSGSVSHDQVKRMIEIAYCEGIVAVAGQRNNKGTARYGFKDFCASQEAGAQSNIKRLINNY